MARLNPGRNTGLSRPPHPRTVGGRSSVAGAFQRTVGGARNRQPPSKDGGGPSVDPDPRPTRTSPPPGKGVDEGCRAGVPTARLFGEGGASMVLRRAGDPGEGVGEAHQHFRVGLRCQLDYAVGDGHPGFVIDIIESAI
jgi:hypothetical protein